MQDGGGPRGPRKPESQSLFSRQWNEVALCTWRGVRGDGWLDLRGVVGGASRLGSSSKSSVPGRLSAICCAITADCVNPAIIAAIEAEPGMTLRTLLDKACGVAEPDEIYMLVASGAIHVDLNAAPIAEPERVRVFLTAEMAAACEIVCREARAGSDIRRDDGQPRESLGGRSEVFLALAAASEQDLAIANRRADIVRQHLAGGNPSCSTPARTVRLWTAQYRSARELYGSGYLGLVPKTGKRGNRTSRLPEISRELLSQFVESDYETLKQKSLQSAAAR